VDSLLADLFHLATRLRQRNPRLLQPLDCLVNPLDVLFYLSSLTRKRRPCSHCPRLRVHELTTWKGGNDTLPRKAKFFAILC
jgi:hypothetical protein